MGINCWLSKMFTDRQMGFISVHKKKALKMLLHVKDEKFTRADVKVNQKCTSPALDCGGGSIKCTWGEFLSQRHGASSEEGLFLLPVAVRLCLSFIWLHHWTVIPLTLRWKDREKDLQSLTVSFYNWRLKRKHAQHGKWTNCPRLFLISLPFWSISSLLWQPIIQ